MSAHLTMPLIKKYPESIILLVFFAFAVNTLVAGLTTNIEFSWQHYAGFAMLVVITYLYFRIHKRLIEILLVSGLLNLVNLNVGFWSLKTVISFTGSETNSVGIQPWFLLASIAYVIINRKWIFGKYALTEEQKQEQLISQVNSWRDRYSDKSASELQQIVTNSRNYQPEAVNAAEQLLSEKYVSSHKNSLLQTVREKKRSD